MTKKKNSAGKYSAKRRSGNGLIIAVIILTVLLLAFAAMLLFSERDGQISPTTGTTEDTVATQIQESQPAENPAVNLGYGIYLLDVGAYTGMYMEDGSDEILSDVLMLVVKNDSEQDVQYAEITMKVGEQQAAFSMTTLPAGESMVLLEKNRMTWDGSMDYEAILPKVENIAYFQEPITMMQDQLKIQIVDGALNVTNISGEDISGNITVYYKNAADDLLYGGITYRVSISGGLKTDELRQVMTNHASDTGTRIMFVTVTQ